MFLVGIRITCLDGRAGASRSGKWTAGTRQCRCEAAVPQSSRGRPTNVTLSNQKEYHIVNISIIIMQTPKIIINVD